jgi:hypothetical protein
LSKDGKVAAEGLESRAWVTRDPNDKTRIKSHPLPEELAARFRGEV